MKKNCYCQFKFKYKFFSVLVMVIIPFCGFSGFEQGKEIIEKSQFENEKNIKEVKRQKEKKSTVSNQDFLKKEQVNEQVNNKKKSNAGIMLNLNIRFADIFQNYISSGLGETINVKSSLLHGDLALMYGFDFGLVLGVNYLTSSTKRTQTKKFGFEEKTEYKNEYQIYGMTVGYQRRSSKETNGFFALFTYFPGGSCRDDIVKGGTYILADCSFKSSYQLSVGRIFTVVSKKNFTMGLGPRINFSETKMTGVMRELPKKFQETTIQRRFIAPAISSWFMW